MTQHQPVETLDDLSKTDYRVPNPTRLTDDETFADAFGQPRDAGSFGAVTENSRGGVRKVLAFSINPLVDIEGVHLDVKVNHLWGRNYSLESQGETFDFTLSEDDHLHVVGGITEGVILRSLKDVEGVVSYRDRKFAVVAGTVFMSTEMDEAPGKTTRELVRTGLTLESALNISYSAASTLKKVHDRHIVHGDVKPENIMSDGKRTTLTDFGNSKMINLGMYSELSYREANEMSLVVKFANALPKIGTPAYSAPETPYEGTSIPGDVFSMHATIYKFLTGERIALKIAEQGWNPDLYNSTKKSMVEKGVPQAVRQAMLFNLSTTPENRDLDLTISALGTSLGAELPAGVRAYSCPSVFAQTQLSEYSLYETAKTVRL
jgi:serine/threonine protein kinase